MVGVAVVSPVLAVRAGLCALLEARDPAASNALPSGPEIVILAEAAHLTELPMVGQALDVIVLASEDEAELDNQAALEGRDDLPALLWLTDDLRAVNKLANWPLRAWGILGMEASQAELLAAIQALHLGLWVGPPNLAARLLPRQSTADQVAEPLTGRENEVLQLLAEGLANKQIAAQLGISEHTVKFHISSIYNKLNASSRTEAVRLGIQQGLIVI